jgi:SOCE-associated regulatory factor of calcium homoeostasis
LTSKGKEVYLSGGHKNPFSDFPTFSLPKLSLWERFSSSFFLFKVFRSAKEILSSVVSTVLSNPLLVVALVWANYRFIRWIGYGFYRWLFPFQAPRTQRQPRSFWPGFFGGGGGGNDPGPPPPYTRRPPSSSRKTYQVPPETQGFNPGFWTGLASGAAAGYGLGSRRSGTETAQHQAAQQRAYTQTTTGSAPRTSGWFGGGGSTSSTSSRDDSEDVQTSGGTHTSTGFGGTRRR